MNKLYTTASILAITTFLGCKANDFKSAQYAEGSAAASSNSYKYLADSEAAAATASDSSATTATAVDSTVSSDITDSRIADMASRMMTDLDADVSSSLSLEEFLAGPEKFAAKANHPKLKVLTDEEKAKMVEKLTTEFNSYAGDDVLLSVDELKTLLLAQAPMVAEYRRGGPGQAPKPRGPQGRFGKKGGVGPQGHGPDQPGQGQVEMQRPSEEELFAKFDVNSDGNLDATEFKSMLQARFHRPSSSQN